MPWYLAFPMAQATGAAEQAAAAAPQGSMSFWMAVLIVLAIFAVSALGGIWLSRYFRLPDQAWRFGTVLFVMIAGSTVVATGFHRIKLGIDLRGGVNWVYEVAPDQVTADKPADGEAPAEAAKQVDMDQLIAAIVERVNPGGQREVTVRPYGANQIEIVLPEVDHDEIERFEKKITSLGTLEFRILANHTDHVDLINAGNALAVAQNENEVKINGEVKARWVDLKADVAPEFERNARIALRTNAGGDRQVLVVLDPFNVTGEYLADTRPGIDQNLRPCVEFSFDAQGAALFGGLTSQNTPDPATGIERQLGIILDGYMQSAPTIQSTITRRGEITGRDYTQESVADLVGVLNAGSLPTALTKEPISKVFTGPSLGKDTIARAKIALTAAVVITMLFMIVYYRFAGVLASLAVLGNLVLTIAVVIAIQAPLTLPGLAGLALTLGMAVDANVLIYERMREELARGAMLRMAIRNGYSRAMSAIVDSNLTTLITATVLYWIGTDQIKGFAVMLWVGIVISMFTAIFCSRLVFDAFEKMRWLKGLKMMQLIGETHFNFIGWWRPAAFASLAIVVVGLVGMFDRGAGMLGIEFTGGVAVTMLSREAVPIATVRAKVSESPDDFPDVTVTDVRETEEAENVRFKIETSNQSPKEVEARLAAVFPDELATIEMQIADVAPVTAADVDAPADADHDDDGADAAGDHPPAQPAEEAGAARDAATDRMLAFAGDNRQTLLALAQDPDATDEGEAEADASAPEAAETEAEETEEPGAERPAAESEPTPGAAEEGGAQAEVDAETPPEDFQPGAGNDAPAPVTPEAAVADPFAGGAKATLKFTVNAPVPEGKQVPPAPISYATLSEEIKGALQAAGKESVPYLLENPLHIEGSSATFDTWTATIALPVEEARSLLEQVQRNLASEPYFPSSSKIGSAVAGNTRSQAVLALVASIVFIVLYLWVRFQKVMYGVAAVVALVHDVLVTLAFLAVSYYVARFVPFLAGALLIDPFKIDLTVMAAVLTIIGYSLNDTIVVFDRIREVRGKSPDLTVDMVNLSVNQTLSRTLLTGLTTMAVVLIMYVWGGTSIHGFAYALFVGLIVGTYSSIYVASPVLLWASGYRKPATTSGASRGQTAAPAAALSKTARG